jgi:HPt (histidine-containing phosphotransfer) domain-containing protein
MTANAMARDRDACVAAGMNDHIGKPFDIGNLVSLLIRITGLKPSPTTTEETVTVPTGAHHLPEIPGLELKTAMNRMSGMQSLYVRTARDFVRGMDTVIPELKQYLAAADMRKAMMRLHSLKGNAGTLGATELAANAAKLEKLISTGSGMQECAEGLGQFEILVSSTQKMLSEAIAALEPQVPNTRPVEANTSGQPVSAAAIAALRRIAALSKAFDLGVLQEFDQAKGLLSVLPAEEVDALNLLLQCLDLEMAATLCEKILTRIDHPAHHRRD